MDSHNNSQLQQTLKQLDVPSEFGEYDSITEADIIVRLEEWRRKAFVVLSDLRTQLQDKESLPLKVQAQVVFAVASFDGSSPWILETSRNLANDILDVYSKADVALVEAILREHIKHNFQNSPHPSLNTATGRKLPRRAGGPMAQQDHYEGQTWKSHPAISNVLSWCVSHIETPAYERLWYLIIPPIMTLLDDFEIRYKLSGVQIVSLTLRHVPGELLKRTGVDGLLFTSLKTCMAFLHNPLTPDLIRAVVPTTLSLITLTTSAGSAQRFDQLCGILGDSIIGGVWIHAMREPETIEATLQVLPQPIKALGIGTARYLKAIIPQLVFPLMPPAPENEASLPFQIHSAQALGVIVEECGPRMHKWKGTILDGVARCWVALSESGADSNDVRELKSSLKSVIQSLALSCPSVADEEFCVLRNTDEKVFGPLFGPPIPRTSDKLLLPDR